MLVSNVGLLAETPRPEFTHGKDPESGVVLIDSSDDQYLVQQYWESLLNIDVHLCDRRKAKC